jgi:uncharacterized membrane protein (UPF0127 family)
MIHPLVLALGCAVAAPDGLPTAAQPPLPTVTLTVAGRPVLAEVADDDTERTAGMMFRTTMAPGTGMLFVYPEARPRSFWMKNTLLPLSIAYLSETGRVVALADMAPQDTRGVPSGAPAMYALEVPQGWFSALGVRVGDQVTGLPAPPPRAR